MTQTNRLTRRLNERLTESDVGDSHCTDEDCYIVVDENEVGDFFKAVREMDLDADTWRSQGTLKGWISGE